MSYSMAGLDGLDASKAACEAYFGANENKPAASKGSCVGGLRAFGGSTGDVLWTCWLDDVVDGMDCTEDLDRDGTLDCLVWGSVRTLVYAYEDDRFSCQPTP